jgi:hypothetical protein
MVPDRFETQIESQIRQNGTHVSQEAFRPEELIVPRWKITNI